jgi:ABC-type branched-subunit amino acid transport system permease subunit
MALPMLEERSCRCLGSQVREYRLCSVVVLAMLGTISGAVWVVELGCTTRAWRDVA